MARVLPFSTTATIIPALHHPAAVTHPPADVPQTTLGDTLQILANLDPNAIIRIETYTKELLRHALRARREGGIR